MGQLERQAVERGAGHRDGARGRVALKVLVVSVANAHRFRSLTIHWVDAGLCSACCVARWLWCGQGGEPCACEERPGSASRQRPPPAPRYAHMDRWQLRETSRAPSAVEIQLARHMQQVLAAAQFSQEYSCVARETVAFFAQQSKLPDELLSHWVAGVCDAPDTHAWVYAALLNSNRTILDAPFSDSQLTEIASQLLGFRGRRCCRFQVDDHRIVELVGSGR